MSYELVSEGFYHNGICVGDTVYEKMSKEEFIVVGFVIDDDPTDTLLIKKTGNGSLGLPLSDISLTFDYDYHAYVWDEIMEKKNKCKGYIYRWAESSDLTVLEKSIYSFWKIKIDNGGSK